MPRRSAAALDPELVLPATLLSRYLFFLARRPVSAANAHYRASRIVALQSLASMFDVPEIRDPLRALTASNLFRVAPEMQSALRPHLEMRMPRDLVVTPHAPAPEAWRDTRRIVVIYGPAIGIGDEILASTVPRALRALAPDAAIEVMTAYDGLWNRIAPDQPATVYRDVATLLRRMRGGADDTMVFVDFERPGLIAAMAHEPEVKWFAELAVGTRTLALLDNRTRRLYEMPAVHRENFYDAVDAMTGWLGADVHRFEARGNRDDDLIVVSPFTSKEEPSERRWRALLLAMLPRTAATRVVLDSGPNGATRAFATAIRDVLRAASIRADLAANGRAATLGEMLDLVRGAGTVVTADSYLAHAAPLFGARTLVVAAEGLEPWRVPSPSSFYFRAELEPEAIGEAMRVLMYEPRLSPRRCAEADALRVAASSVDVTAPIDALLDGWQRCADAHNALVATMPEWPRPFATLVSDERYGRLMPRAPRTDGIGEPELRAHLAGCFADCARSNLWKYIREAV